MTERRGRERETKEEGNRVSSLSQSPEFGKKGINQNQKLVVEGREKKGSPDAQVLRAPVLTPLPLFSSLPRGSHPPQSQAPERL